MAIDEQLSSCLQHLPASRDQTTNVTLDPSEGRDLSFNNLRGRVPDQLFNLSPLINLFLGSNKLTGSLPLQKIRAKICRLFYLSLCSALSSGLNCLQKNFQCNRETPICFDFQSFLQHRGHRKHLASAAPESDDDEIDPRYGVEKRLVPSGPNPLHH
nr:probable LRR receptor-like serine/threonine-protein kinase At1g56140 [Ipomoea trifida]